METALVTIIAAAFSLSACTGGVNPGPKCQAGDTNCSETSAPASTLGNVACTQGPPPTGNFEYQVQNLCQLHQGQNNDLSNLTSLKVKTAGFSSANRINSQQTIADYLKSKSQNQLFRLIVPTSAPASLPVVVDLGPSTTSKETLHAGNDLNGVVIRCQGQSLTVNVGISVLADRGDALDIDCGSGTVNVNAPSVNRPILLSNSGHALKLRGGPSSKVQFSDQSGTRGKIDFKGGGKLLYDPGSNAYVEIPKSIGDSAPIQSDGQIEFRQSEVSATTTPIPGQTNPPPPETKPPAGLNVLIPEDFASSTADEIRFVRASDQNFNLNISDPTGLIDEWTDKRVLVQAPSIKWDGKLNLLRASGTGYIPEGQLVSLGAIIESDKLSVRWFKGTLDCYTNSCQQPSDFRNNPPTSDFGDTAHINLKRVFDSGRGKTESEVLILVGEYYKNRVDVGFSPERRHAGPGVRLLFEPLGAITNTHGIILPDRIKTVSVNSRANMWIGTANSQIDGEQPNSAPQIYERNHGIGLMSLHTDRSLEFLVSNSGNLDIGDEGASGIFVSLAGPGSTSGIINFGAIVTTEDSPQASGISTTIQDRSSVNIFNLQKIENKGQNSIGIQAKTGASSSISFVNTGNVVGTATILEKDKNTIPATFDSWKGISLSPGKDSVVRFLNTGTIHAKDKNAVAISLGADSLAGNERAGKILINNSGRILNTTFSRVLNRNASHTIFTGRAFHSRIAGSEIRFVNSGQVYGEIVFERGGHYIARDGSSSIFILPSIDGTAYSEIGDPLASINHNQALIRVMKQSGDSAAQVSLDNGSKIVVYIPGSRLKARSALLVYAADGVRASLGDITVQGQAFVPELPASQALTFKLETNPGTTCSTSTRAGIASLCKRIWLTWKVRTVQTTAGHAISQVRNQLLSLIHPTGFSNEVAKKLIDQPNEPSYVRAITHLLPSQSEGAALRSAGRFGRILAHSGFDAPALNAINGESFTRRWGLSSGNTENGPDHQQTYETAIWARAAFGSANRSESVNPGHLHAGYSLKWSALSTGTEIPVSSNTKIGFTSGIFQELLNQSDGVSDRKSQTAAFGGLAYVRHVAGPLHLEGGIFAAHGFSRTMTRSRLLDRDLTDSPSLDAAGAIVKVRIPISIGSWKIEPGAAVIGQQVRQGHFIRESAGVQIHSSAASDLEVGVSALLSISRTFMLSDQRKLQATFVGTFEHSGSLDNPVNNISFSGSEKIVSFGLKGGDQRRLTLKPKISVDIAEGMALSASLTSQIYGWNDQENLKSEHEIGAKLSWSF